MWSQSIQSSNISSKFMPISEVSQIKNNLSQVYKTPIKQSLIQNQNNTTPFNFNFNNFFGTLFSSGNNYRPEQINNSPFLQNKDNFFLFKTSLEKSSLKITPGSEYKIQNENINNMNQIKNEQTKKNLYETFNSVKNENFLTSKKEVNNNNDNINNNNNNKLNSNNQFLFSSPRTIKRKKIFECLDSTNITDITTSRKKKKRFRKNSEQLKYLLLFYNKNKRWNKKQIKKLSEEIGLKENKVYKWLWDQRNKELKNAKFIITNNTNNSN